MMMNNILTPKRNDQTRIFALDILIKNYTEESILRFHCIVFPGLLQNSDLLKVWKINVKREKSSFAEMKGHCWFSVAKESVDQPGEKNEKTNLSYGHSEDIAISQTSGPLLKTV